MNQSCPELPINSKRLLCSYLMPSILQLQGFLKDKGEKSTIYKPNKSPCLYHLVIFFLAVRMTLYLYNYILSYF